MKTYRFVSEYANYIKEVVRKSDLPKERKAGYINDIDRIIKNLHYGMVTLNDAMATLVRAEAWINSVS